MRPPPRISRITAPLVLVLAALTAAVGAAAAAAIGPAHIAAVDHAAEAFLAVAKDAYQTGNPPRLADPAVRPWLDTVFDTADLDAGEPAPYTALSALTDWAMRVVSVGSVYIFSGTGIPDFEHLTSIDEKQEQRIAQNTVTYAPEMGRYFDAEMQIEEAIVSCVANELANNPAAYESPQAQHGLQTIRGGIKQTLIGVMTTLLTPGIDPGWMHDRLAILAKLAPLAARFLSVQDRSELRDVAREVADRLEDPVSQASLGAIANQLGS